MENCSFYRLQKITTWHKEPPYEISDKVDKCLVVNDEFK